MLLIVFLAFLLVGNLSNLKLQNLEKFGKKCNVIRNQQFNTKGWTIFPHSVTFSGS